MWGYPMAPIKGFHYEGTRAAAPSKRQLPAERDPDVCQDACPLPRRCEAQGPNCWFLVEQAKRRSASAKPSGLSAAAIDRGRAATTDAARRRSRDLAEDYAKFTKKGADDTPGAR